ncbi:MAG: BrxA/BrxB family bacilliredoxin [Calditrichaeota bacterium]|nr:MAG: BrxA/BrxB family bacilliredoxin [Calditrichota bacterium]
MMYPEELVAPMREELTRIGFRELRTPEEVAEVIENAEGTVFAVINSVCGCAAGMARPGVALALQHDVLPDHLVTVFAGQDAEATAKLRSYITNHPPSSPSMALFRNGELIWFMPRYEIEGSSAEEIARKLQAAFDTYCSRRVAAE